MHRLHRVLACVVGVAVLTTACGTPDTTVTVTAPTTVTVIDDTDRLVAAKQTAERARIVAAFVWISSQPTTTTVAPPRPQMDVPAGSGLEPCGGDLPPCWVARRESGGRYDAINVGGCGGRNCYGKWQFSGEWACRLGLPCDLTTATPEQQDEAARRLWNGGAGCANWSAC